jgi:DNA-binding NtrC family response regulator
VIEVLKSRIWSLLAEKDVSLAMLFDRRGRILWHKGRSVRARTVEEGVGFPKSSIRTAIERGSALHEDDVVVTCSGDGLPQSARVLYVKSLVVLPIDASLFLYADSGSKESFTPSDREVLRVLGELLRETLETIKRSETEPEGITGKSEAMRHVRELALQYALEEEPVLLLGETGVGKSHVAELIHRWSGRTGRLVVAHAPSIPESLFEAEMFGHAKGAFTGAGEKKQGLVQEAERGTFFLDEVSEVPTSFQAKLLMLAERRRYRVLGEAQERQADVRLVAASNRDLAAEVKSKRFRSDLFYRLNVLPISIPPLRERRDDVRDLVEQHLALLRGKRPSEAFWDAMRRHDWPGNVRELIHVLKRAGITLPGPSIGGEIAQLLAEEKADDGEAGACDRIEAAIRRGGSFWDTAWRSFLARELNRAELRALLVRWYRAEGGSLRALSEALHVEAKDYPRFVAALHKYDVHPAR